MQSTFRLILILFLFGCSKELYIENLKAELNKEYAYLDCLEEDYLDADHTADCYELYIEEEYRRSEIIKELEELLKDAKSNL